MKNLKPNSKITEFKLQLSRFVNNEYLKFVRKFPKKELIISEKTWANSDFYGSRMQGLTYEKFKVNPLFSTTT